MQSHQNTDTILLTIDPHYGNLNRIPYHKNPEEVRSLNQPSLSSSKDYQLRGSGKEYYAKIMEAYWIS